jgi:FkbH-like protein
MNGLSDYRNRYADLMKGHPRQFSNKLKVAVLASSTMRGLQECLFVKAHDLKISLDIHMGGYNQYNQEILNHASALYASIPDIVFMFIDTRELLGDSFLSYYALSDEERVNLFEDKLNHLDSLITALTTRLGGKIVLHNFEVPLASPLGIIDNRQELGYIDFVKRINAELARRYRENSQVFVFDYESFCSKWGKVNTFDYKMYYLADIKLQLEYLPALCDEYLRYIKALLALNRKCIVLDLDNTLWGGVVGEDGISGIRLGNTPEGRPFLEFQKYILSLFNRGIILAINSKNNPDDALEVLRNHPEMVLREKHFASIQINWNDKISNMKAIAKEINIGLDSLVFFDDDKLNREMVRSALPEVHVVDLPDDPSLYLSTIMALDDFDSFILSDEDRQKGQMYADQRKRQELATGTKDITEYLAALEMVVTIEHANPFTIPRISQLTQKTNQFNMTTRRYTEEEIKSIAEDKNCLVFSVKVTDKFGDNGITGVAIVRKQKGSWSIETFLLSCRVIGRGVEDVMLAYIVENAQKAHAEKIVAEFIPTKKNAPAKDFYRANGLTLAHDKAGSQEWVTGIKEGYGYPQYIKVVKK